MEPAPAGGTVGGAKLPLWIKKLAEKWEFVEWFTASVASRILSPRMGGGSVVAGASAPGIPMENDWSPGEGRQKAVVWCMGFI